MFALVTLALAQTAPPVVNGSTTSDYPGVGALIACSGNSCFSFCSGTLVHENWVITAAHCIEPLRDYDRSGYTVWFGVGPKLGSLTDSSEITDYAEHPGYNAYTLDHDIGLARLKGLTSVEPVPVNEDPVTNGWSGKELQYVGYGVTGDNNNDGGVKRTAAMPVARYDSGFVYSSDTADMQNICYGDSGGAALEAVEDGAYELAGVNSHVFGVSYSNRMCEGGGSGATRVDAHLDWIRGYVDVGGYEPWEEPEDEPEDEPGGEDPGEEPGGGSFEAWAEPIHVPSGGMAWIPLFIEGAEDPRISLLQPPEHGEVSIEDGGALFLAGERGGEERLTLAVDEADERRVVEVLVVVVDRASATSGGCQPGLEGAWLVIGLGLLGIGRRRQGHLGRVRR